MTDSIPRLRTAIGMALIAGAAVLAGCGPTPVSTTTTTTEERVVTPPPPMSTTTTTTEQIRRP